MAGTYYFMVSEKDIFIKAVLHLILDKKIQKIDKGLGMDVINVFFPMKF